MELTEIIAELENYTGKLPRQALERAIEEREVITPVLLETLEKWKDNLEELLELQFLTYCSSGELEKIYLPAFFGHSLLILSDPHHWSFTPLWLMLRQGLRSRILVD